jgi:hypothetical protein
MIKTQNKISEKRKEAVVFDYPEISDVFNV